MKNETPKLVIPIFTAIQWDLMFNVSMFPMLKTDKSAVGLKGCL
jgi:hypothetical protein